jgi:RNA recognition motif-containing protein
MDKHKIFVGNIPFQCTNDEFNECFNIIDGVIKAEIIYKPYTMISRGFGFITFDSKDNAQKILSQNNIFLKDRLLRFTEYESKLIKYKESIPDNLIKLKKNNFIMIKNLIDIDRNDLYEEFNKYGYIGRYFIACHRKTGNLKNYGIVEIFNDELFDTLLNVKHIIIKNNTYDIVKWTYTL